MSPELSYQELYLDCVMDGYYDWFFCRLAASFNQIIKRTENSWVLSEKQNQNCGSKPKHFVAAAYHDR
jgi:hypothetical protein